MKNLTILFVVLLLASCNGKGGSSGEAETSSNPIQEDAVVTEFMKLVNDHRKSIGLKALAHAPEMALIAYDHSEDMAKKEVSFGHTGFSSRCTQARNAMDGGNLCAENVAMGQKTAQAAFTAWMNSSSHRANLENARLTHSGLGYTKAANGTIYWTHLFLEK